MAHRLEPLTKIQETSLVENSNTREYSQSSTSPKHYNYENANRRRECENPSQDEDLDEKASSKEGSRFANHAPIEGEDEEEEIEMEDEDHYNKMKRREEYMRRKQLISTDENTDDGTIANQESVSSEGRLSSTAPPSPKITPRPLMPVGRLPPIQLTAKTKHKKRKGEKEHPTSNPDAGDNLHQEEKAVPKRRTKRDLSHVDYK